jgi:outer membrane protein assembly factor BamA
MIQNDNAKTRAGLWTAYAFASETWQFRFDVRQKLMASGMLEASGSLFRITDTDDEETVSRAENTVFATLTGSDYRDYFGADGGELALTMRYHELGSFSLKYRNIDYRWLSASRNLWHLFRPNHQFRDNFSTLGPAADPEDALEDNSSSATFTIRIAPVETGQHPIGFNGSLVLAFEVAGGLLGGDYDYDRLTLSGQGGWISDYRHRIALRVMYGAGRRDLSPNKLFYSGGIGTLRGYPQKIFFGDQSFVGNIEYHFVYWENPLGDAAVILFCDLGRTTFDNNFWDPDEFFSDIGVGLDFGDMFRINAAKGLDNTDRDIKVSVRMTRPW